jgi:hypothetical protein
LAYRLKKAFRPGTKITKKNYVKPFAIIIKTLFFDSLGGLGVLVADR